MGSEARLPRSAALHHPQLWALGKLLSLCEPWRAHLETRDDVFSAYLLGLLWDLNECVVNGSEHVLRIWQP